MSRERLLTRRLSLVALCGLCEIVTSGCERSPQPQAEAPDVAMAYGSDHAARPVVVTTTVYTADDLYDPNIVVVADSFLVVVTPWHQPALWVINSSSGTLVSQAEGPRRGGFLRSAIFARDTVWLADAGRLEIRAIPIGDLITPLHWDELPMFPVAREFAELVALEPPGFWLSDLSGSGAYFVMDRHGNVARNVGDPDDGLPDVGIRPFVEATSRLPDGGSYVAAGYWSSDVALRDLEGRVLRQFEPPIYFVPSFWAGNRGGVPTVVPGRDAQVGYLTVMAQSQAVYGLFSGRNHYPQGIAAFRGNEIHEFTYDGKLTVYHLDRTINSFSSAGEREFYAVTRDDSAAVIRFTLPNIADSLEVGR